LDQKLKSDSHPFLIPNIPLFHHSLIPSGVKGNLHPSGVKPKPGPLSPDLYLEDDSLTKKNLPTVELAGRFL
jgi:hypothetical protein